MVNVITQHMDVWTSAQMTKSTAGRGNSGKQSAYGIKKLRELILELAVRGKLVPQDPNDEPASVLLEKIAKEKARLIKAGEIKKQTPFPEISLDEEPFDLPSGWKWARIGNIGHDWGQKTPDTDFTYIDVSAIDNVNGIIKSAEIVSSTDAPSRARKIVKVGTVIYSTVRPYLKNICVISQEYLPEPIASTAFAILHPLQEMPGKFLAFYFRSPEFVKYVESVQTGIAYPAINDKQFFGGIIPIPPLAEQHRIVAKVDELMALCDQLEQQQTDSHAAHQTLVETLLGALIAEDGATANNAEAISGYPSQDGFAAAWQRIAEHFDTLFTTEHSIDQLKQTILQLAVMGKLVPQDPNDEPASVLFEKIIHLKDQLIKAKKFQGTAKLKNKVNTYVFPDSWKAVQIGDLCPSIVPNRDKPKSFSGQIPWVTLPSFPENGFYLDHDAIELGLTDEEVEKYSARLIPENTVLMSCVGRFGLTAINKIPVVANQQIHGFVVLDGIVPEFLSTVIKVATKSLEDTATSTTIAYLNKTNCESIEFGLPPTAEQHRIVAKVDELMTLCDTLKVRIKLAETMQIHLADVIVEQAVA